MSKGNKQSNTHKTVCLHNDYYVFCIGPGSRYSTFYRVAVGRAAHRIRLSTQPTRSYAMELPYHIISNSLTYLPWRYCKQAKQSFVGARNTAMARQAAARPLHTPSCYQARGGEAYCSPYRVSMRDNTQAGMVQPSTDSKRK